MCLCVLRKMTGTQKFLEIWKSLNYLKTGRGNTGLREYQTRGNREDRSLIVYDHCIQKHAVLRCISIMSYRNWNNSRSHYCTYTVSKQFNIIQKIYHAVKAKDDSIQRDVLYLDWTGRIEIKYSTPRSYMFMFPANMLGSVITNS